MRKLTALPRCAFRTLGCLPKQVLLNTPQSRETETLQVGEVRQQANRALKQARQEMLETEHRISSLQQLVRAASRLRLGVHAIEGQRELFRSLLWGDLCVSTCVLTPQCGLFGLTGPSGRREGEDGAAAG